MSRKNIFEILQRDYNIAEEALRIERLFNGNAVDFGYNGIYFSDSIEGFFDTYLFLEWDHSNTFLDVSEYRMHLGIVHEWVMSQSLNFNDCLKYFEYVINVVLQVSISSGALDKVILNRIKRNIELVLSHFNYKLHSNDKKRYIIIIEKNPAATTTAELVEHDDISRDIIRYNHFMLKSKLDEKRKILTQLYKEFERVRDSIKDVVKINKSHTLDSDLGLLFNNTDIRHYKGNNKVMQEKFKVLTDEEKEEWYDRVYDLFLAAILAHNYVDIKDDIRQLRTEN